MSLATPRSFPRIRYATFVAAFTTGNLLLFGWPLYSYAASSLHASWTGALDLLVLTIVQAVLMVVLLTAVSLLSLRAMKALCIALLVGNALALYFIGTYHVLLDKTMMGNVFDTDHAEALDLLHPKLLVYLVLLAALPGWIVARTAIVDSTRLARLRLLAIAILLGCAAVYAGSPTWLWLDKQAKHLGAVMLPWSYLANGARNLQDRADAKRRQEPLPPLHFVPAVDGSRKTIVVLAIGESARAADFSLYGYGRNTNPELARAGVIALPGARACATYTTAAIRCMLSHLGNDAPARVSQETLPNYLQREGVQVIWRSNNWGEPPLKVGQYQRADEIRKACTGPGCAGLGHDEALLYGLGETLAASPSRRIFVVLHLAGSHGPTYSRKYPPEFARFQPVCTSVDLGQCSPQSLVNAYDNTIVYTDHVLADAIRILQAVPGSASTLIYMSDHGESLGEHGFYLHGAPNSLAPEVQRVVPLLVWMSPAFSADKAVTARDMLAKAPFSDNNIFHSVLGAFGGRSAVYAPRSDLFSHVQ